MRERKSPTAYIFHTKCLAFNQKIPGMAEDRKTDFQKIKQAIKTDNTEDNEKVENFAIILGVFLKSNGKFRS